MAFYRAAIGGGGGIPAECKCILYKTSANINIIDYNYITINGNTVTFLKACEGYIQAGRGNSASVSGTATFTNLIHKTETYTGDLFSFSASVGDTLTVSNSAAYYDWSLYIADGVASPMSIGSLIEGHDTSSHTTGTTTTYTCGFEPKYLLVRLMYKSGNNLYMMECMYKSDAPNSFEQLYYNGTGSTRALPNTSFTGIGSITSTGFTVYANQQIQNIYWIASSEAI